MILRRLVVECFAGLNPGARIDSFGERFTLIHGPNEAGKSTLLKALEFALFQRHKVGGREVVDAIVPRGDEVAPRVALEFDHDGRRLRITKQFVRGASCLLEEERSGRFERIAEGEAADDRLSELLQFRYAARSQSGSELFGLGEVLLAPQGALRVEAPFGETARARFVALLGGAVTTRATHELRERVAKRFEEWFSPTGKVKGSSPLAALRAALQVVDAELPLLAARVRQAHDFEAQLADDPAAAAELARRRAELLAAREQARRERDEWRAAQAAAALHEEKLRHARAAAQAAAERRDLAAAKVRDGAAAERALEEAERAASAAQEALALEQAAARGEELEAERLAERRRAQDDEERLLREQHDHARAIAQAGELAAKLDAWTRLAQERAVVVAELEARPLPQRDEVRRLRKLREELHGIERSLAALALRVTFTPNRPITWTTPHGTQSLAAGAAAEVAGADPLRFALEGVGEFVVRGPEVAERGRLAQRATELAREIEAHARPFGSSDPEQLEELAARRQQLEAEQAKLAARAAELFADEAARSSAARKLAAERQVAATLQAAHPEWAEAPVDAARLESRGELLKERRRDLEREAKAQVERVKRALERRDAALAKARAAEQQRAAAVATRAALARELAVLAADGQDEVQRSAAVAATTAAVAALATEQAALAARVAALATAEEAYDRVSRALVQLDDGVVAAQLRRERLRGELAMLTRDGLWQRLGELESRRVALLEELERTELESAAIERLHRELSAAQQQQVDALVAPVDTKVTRMAQALLREPSARVQFDESLVPATLTRDGRAAIEAERLSAGTRDQLGLLTRIALGELFAERHGRHVLLLDDPLVNADPERRGRLLDILLRASHSLQIVVFTCDEGAWHGLPADATRLSLERVRANATDRMPPIP